jgi:hypothetical protein
MAALLDVGLARGSLVSRCARVVAAAALATSGLSFVWAVGSAPPPAMALAVDPGRVVAWGLNSSHQTDVPADALSGVTRVSGGCGFSLALRSGKVIAWGDNEYHQTDVPAAALSGVIAISAGCEHALALKSNGSIVAWGQNLEGETSVPSLPSGFKWFAIGAGGEVSLGLATDGTSTMMCRWGDGGDACKTPTKPPADVEATRYAYLLQNEDGTVQVAKWSSSLPDSLLTGSTGIANVIGIDLGWNHALALRSDGTVAAWGGNDHGQLNVPFGLAGVKVVAAGDAHSLALKSGGTIVAWGRDDFGQAAVPALPPDSHYSFVSAGALHSLAIVAPNAPGAPTVPDAPPYVVGWPGDGKATVWWTAPASDGGSPITEYNVTSAPDGKTCRAFGMTHCTVAGLTNGTAYTFTVTATNDAGSGPPSGASLPVTPGAGYTLPPDPLESMPTESTAATASAGPSTPPAGGGGSGGPDPILALGAGIGLGLALAGALVVAYRRGRRAGAGSGGSAPPPAETGKPQR